MSDEFVNEQRFFATDFEGEKQYFLRPTMAVRKDIRERMSKEKLKTEEQFLEFGMKIYINIACKDDSGEMKYASLDDIWDCHIADQIMNKVTTHFLGMVGITADKTAHTKKATAKKKRSSRTTKKGS